MSETGHGAVNNSNHATPANNHHTKKRVAPAAAEDGLIDDGTAAPQPKRQQVGPKTYTVTVLVPIDAVGLIIGKGGSVFKTLNEETGARVRVQEYSDVAQGSRQRGVLITGTAEAIEAAQREILEHLKQRRITQDVSKAAADREEGAAEETGARNTARWMIPAELSGLLIGKRGMGIMAINQESGAFVKVAHEQELPPGSAEKLVYITGSDEQNAKAIELIKAKVGGRPVETDGEEYVFVNTRAIAFLLGKQGAELKRLCEESGARVQVATAAELEMGSVDIKVRLHGSDEQVTKARAMIRDRMELWQKQNPQLSSSSEDPDSQETSIKLAVPAPAVSGLIGKAGAGVKEINAKSGASVKFLPPQQAPSHDAHIDQRPILLTGPLRAVFKAQRLLLERLQALPLNVREPQRAHTSTVASTTKAVAKTHAPLAVKGAGLLDTSLLGQQALQAAGGGLYTQPGLLGDYRPGT